MAQWKKLLVSGDAVADNIATSDLTISGNLRALSLGNSSGTGVFSIADNANNGILSVSHDQTSTAATVTLGGLTRISEDASGNQGSLRFYQGAVNTNYVAIKAPTLASSYTLTLPTTDGSANQVLQTNGSGVLSWVDQSSGGGTIDGTGSAGKVALWSDADTLTFDSGIYYGASQDSITLGNLTATDAGGGSGLIVSVTTQTEKIVLTTAGITSAGDYGAGTRMFSKLGSGTIAAGKLYYIGASSAWALADKDAESTSSGLLAVGDNTASANLMIQEGYVKMASNQGWNTVDPGTKVYVGDSGNLVASTASFTTGDIARIVGYVINASSGIIYFNPDQSYIKIA